MKIPVSIITGYLGAGKTTLLKQILEQTEKKIAVLMNEFGDIAIDDKIIKGENVNITELAGGCVCCSLTGEFELAIKEIIEKFSPEMIIIETTGVAEPDAMVFDIEQNLPEIKLDSIITLVDSESIVKYPRIGHTGMVQIEMADILILNKKDLITKEQLKQVRKLVRAVNPKAIIFTASKCKMNTDLLFGLTIERVLKKIRHGAHKINIEYFSCSSQKILNREKFEEFISKLHKNIYRAKGFVNLEDGTYLFNYVAGRWELEKWPEQRETELVFIGKKARELENDVIKKLKECEK